eukprot:gene5608-5846_t
MIRYYSADDASQLARNNTSRCQLLMAADGSSTNTDASRAVVGFKAYTQGVVLDFALYYIPGQLMMGEAITSELPVASIRECMQACTSHGEECVGVKITGDAFNNSIVAGDQETITTLPAIDAVSSSGEGAYSCLLLRAATDANWVSSYRIMAEALVNLAF